MDALVFFIGFVSALVGSIAAGAGLVLVPALLFLGYPIHVVLGTSFIAGIGMFFGDMLVYQKNKNLGVTRKEMVTLAAIGLIGMIIGARIVIAVETEILSKIVGVLLIVLLILIFKKKDLGVSGKKVEGRNLLFAHVAFFFTKVWSGFFNPGSGIFETYVRVRLYGYTFLQGKAATRLASIVSGIGAAVVFALSDLIDYRVAIVMFFGMFFGGIAGSLLAVKRGDAWVKPLLGIIIVVTAIKMLFFS